MPHRLTVNQLPSDGSIILKQYPGHLRGFLSESMGRYLHLHFMLQRLVQLSNADSLTKLFGPLGLTCPGYRKLYV